MFYLIKDLFHTLFPDLCLACDKLPKAQKASFCVECLHNMPYTDHFFIKDNSVTNHFRGRISLQHGAAILHFREGSIVQKMLHQLKYKGRREIGEVMGQIAGEKILESTLFKSPDIIIPVPIHANKIKRRGYNQSSVFGLALAETLKKPFRDDIIIKHVETQSQTGKSRTERINNVTEVFKIKDDKAFSSKHVMIVDDVVTTGATLEACCLKAKEAGAVQISILCIAAAEK